MNGRRLLAKRPGIVRKQGRTCRATIQLLAMFLLAATARADENNVIVVLPYAAQVRGAQQDDWFLSEIRKFRSYPRLDRAYRLMSSNRLEEARRELQQYLALNPGDAQARTAYFMLLVRLNDYSEAIRQADMVLQEQPGAASALLVRGQARTSLHQFDAALADFQAVAADSHTSREDQLFASNAVANLALTLGKHEVALAALDKVAAALNDQGYDLHFRRGLAWESLGRLADADASYHSALKYASGSAERLTALKACGNVEKKRGDWEAAQKSFRSALELDPHSPQIMRLLAETTYEAKDYAQATYVMRNVLSFESNPKDREFLASLLAARKDYSGAIEQYSKLLAGPITPEARYRTYLNVGYAYSNLGEHSEAVIFFRKAADLRGDANALSALAQALEQSGQTADAIQVLLGAVERFPASDMHVKLGNLYAKIGDNTSAARHLEEAVRTTDSVDLHFQLGMLYVTAGDNDNALHHLDQALRGDLPVESRRTAYRQQGYIYTQMGQHQAAVDSFREAMTEGLGGAAIRQDLGFALFRIDRWEEALKEFLFVVGEEHTPANLLQVARCYQQLGQNSMAIRYLRLVEASWDPSDQLMHKQLYNELGYLYAEEADYASSADTLQKSLELQPDSAIAVRLGRIQRILGRPDEAEQTLLHANASDLPLDLQLTRLDELAKIYEDRHEIDKAIDMVTQAKSLQPSADRDYRLGLYYLDLKRTDLAVSEMEAAVASDRQTNAYSESLAYVYKNQQRYREAAQLFESVLKQHPERVNLYQDLAYTYMKVGDNAQAVRYFRRAIDARRDAMSTSLNDQKAVDQDLYAMRQEVANLSQRYDFTFYQSYRDNGVAANSSSLYSGSGLIPSQGGGELFYQPPGIGFRDERIFQVFMRMLWSNRPESLDIDRNSLQAGIGIRYKPLKSQNLFFSGERLIKVGALAVNDWLLRASYSWGVGYDLRPHHRSWNNTQFYGDVGYFTQRGGTWAYYGEMRQGLTVNFANKLLLTPHLAIDGRRQKPDAFSRSYLEGGAGLAFRFFFNQSRYELHRSSLEFLIQYKHGISPSSRGGLVFTTAWRFSRGSVK
jgi:bacteriophage N4 adsorption protein A